jgi:putative ABC transport system ATP-binding protein
VIKLENISKTYGEGGQSVRVLEAVDLEIAAGEFVALMGRSGSGKSTLLNILGCLETPSGGSYSLDGVGVVGRSDSEVSTLRNRAIGFVFQSFHLLPQLTALENVQLPLIYSPAYPPDAATRAARLLNEVGLSDRASFLPSKLSGGQQQRVAIARALVTQPKVLLADEPTGNLDELSATTILEIIRVLNAQGLTIVLATHDRAVASCAQRIVTVNEGRVTTVQQLPQ